MPLQPRIQVFDPSQGVAITERRLPHWSQPGTITFITWRTWDSLPKSVVERWRHDRIAWLAKHSSHLAPRGDKQCGHLAPRDETASRGARSPLSTPAYQKFASERFHADLDACHGECVLRRPKLAKIVADAIRYFDGDRYELTDFVVMPNHVHVLAAFPDEQSLLRQCDSWKHFTATQINRALSRQDRFWQQDSFDHLIRSPEQFSHLRRYIAENPHRSRLRPGEYIHYSK